MPKSRITEFARRSRDVRRLQPYGGYYRQAEVPLDDKLLRVDRGLLDRHCSHRGASLEYDLPTDEGIRSCYHSWHFACNGNIPETPNDPDSSLKQRLCHPAYPVHHFRMDGAT